MRIPRRLREAWRNAPLFALTTIVALALASLEWSAIFAQNTAVLEIAGRAFRMAWSEAAISTALSLLGLVLGLSAAAMASDPRAGEKARAWGAQALAVGVLAVPGYYASLALALPAQVARADAYRASAAFEADRALAADRMADSRVRGDAAESLKQAIRPTRAAFDPFAAAWVALVLGANMLAARLGWRERPEKPAEARARVMLERIEKGRRTRERNRRRGGNRVSVLEDWVN